MHIRPLGDSAVAVVVADELSPAAARRAQRLADCLGARRLAGVVDVSPAHGQVAVVYDPAIIAHNSELSPFTAVCRWIDECASAPAPSRVEGRTIEIPVCYGGEHGRDLALVADHAKLDVQEVIRRHHRAKYFVSAIGFLPGFAYLGGLPPELHAPRRATPRPRVPAGSVGIGGGQTGIYPSASPGGWNLIGRTPMRMFDPTADQPSLLRVGDIVRFSPITPAEFDAWK